MLLNVLEAQAIAVTFCPLCGDGASTEGAASILNWLLVVGLGAAVVVRAFLKKRDSSYLKKRDSSYRDVGGRQP